MTPQERLQALHQSNLAKGLQPLPDDPKDPLDPLPGIPLSGDLTRLDDASLTELLERARRFKKRYPYGEPHGKYLLPFRMYIYVRDVMSLRHPNMKERSAYRLLSNIKALRENKSNAPVTVKEYCAFTNENEDEVRTYLNELDDEYRKRGILPPRD